MEKILKWLDCVGLYIVLAIIIFAFFFAKVYDVMVKFWPFFCFAFMPFLVLAFLWEGFIWIGLIVFIAFSLFRSFLEFDIDKLPTE